MPTSNENVAKNLEAIKHAIDDHDERCPGNPVAIRMHPIEVERLDFETVFGLRIEEDPKQQTGTFRVVCDLEEESGEGRVEDAVSEQELVHA